LLRPSGARLHVAWRRAGATPAGAGARRQSHRAGDPRRAAQPGAASASRASWRSASSLGCPSSPRPRHRPRLAPALVGPHAGAKPFARVQVQVGEEGARAAGRGRSAASAARDREDLDLPPPRHHLCRRWPRLSPRSGVGPRGRSVAPSVDSAPPARGSASGVSTRPRCFVASSFLSGGSARGRENSACGPELLRDRLGKLTIWVSTSGTARARAGKEDAKRKAAPRRDCR
jgi:hypothetical protein